MAFSINGFTVISSSKGAAKKLWAYSSSDTFSTIEVVGYFSEVQGRVGVDDLIYITDSTRVTVAYKVIVSNPSSPENIEITDLIDSAVVPDGSITTAKLDADAVTNAKLADEAVSLENLDSGITPAFKIVKVNFGHSAPGGNIVDPLILSTDIVIANLSRNDPLTNFLTAITPTNGGATLTFNEPDGPSNNVSYVVYRQVT